MYSSLLLPEIPLNYNGLKRKYVCNSKVGGISAISTVSGRQKKEESL
jgi:hypothetical protein